MKTTATLELTGMEVVFLSDSLCNARNISSDKEEFGYLKDLVINLSSLYLELVNPDGILEGPLSIEISELECWLLRSHVRTGDIGIDGKTTVGVTLLTKLYKILQNYANERSEPGLVELGLSGYDEPMLTEEAKADLKEQRYARWQPREDTYPC